MDFMREIFSEYSGNIFVGLCTYIWLFIWDLLADDDHFGFAVVVMIVAGILAGLRVVLPEGLTSEILADRLSEGIIAVITMLFSYREKLGRLVRIPAIGIPLVIVSVYYMYIGGFNIWEHFENERRKTLPEVSGIYQAAEKGDPGAQNHIGLMYLEGNFFVKSYSKALYWFERSASQGSAGAAYNYAYMLDKGYGTDKNQEKAFRWYMKAAKQGIVPAENRIGVMYGRGEGVKKDLRKSLEYYTLAAEHGNKYAMANLGYVYAYGMKRDYPKSYMYYYAAMLAGNDEAEEKLKELVRRNRLSNYQLDVSENEARNFIGRLKEEGRL
ncbi:MAG: sel1 repeat family protein [Synergistaceae bacterium]|nr:sel1 repeat family protein [Synergistaceae bacterium]